MSDETQNLSEMKYNDLKALAKERGLSASGTKDELVARLSEADGAEESAPEADTETTEAPASKPSTVAPNTPAAQVPASPASDRVAQTQADRELKSDAKAMKTHLDKQPKVSIMIPFEVGENPEMGKKVKFHVNLNGYAVDVPRGVYVEVPQQIADVIKARLESEGKIGSQWRIDRDPAKQEALG